MKITDKINLDQQGLIEHGPITIVAFGDSVNDIEMLKFAGKGVIMHSATAKLDEYAYLRTELDEGGVTEGIEKIFFGENK